MPSTNQIAQEANTYARNQIKEGSTQLQNNVYSIQKQQEFNRAIIQLRKASIDTVFFLNIQNILTDFEKRIADCKKLGLGNCLELAFMALDYTLRNHPEVTAEVYEIRGGDHVFLVLGRQEFSDANDPTTWGPNAYICDPWANETYSASEYLIKTKNFSYKFDKEGRQHNFVEDFDPQRHFMAPMPDINNTFLIKESQQLNNILIPVFNRINQTHCDIYDDLAKDLEKIANRLVKKYGEHDPKTKVIREQIKIIKEQTATIRESYEKYANAITAEYKSKPYYAHKEVNDDMQRTIKAQLGILKTTGEFTNDADVTLNTYHKEESLITLIMKFLDIKPTSTRQLTKSLETADKKLNELDEEIHTTFKPRFQ